MANGCGAIGERQSFLRGLAHRVIAPWHPDSGETFATSFCAGYLSGTERRSAY